MGNKTHPNNFVFWARLDVLLGLRLSGGTDTLAEVSNLVDELGENCEIQNEKQHGNAFHKLYTD